MDLETRIKVNLLQWIRRVLKKPLSNAASTLRYVIGTDSLQAYFAPKRGANLKWTTGIKFYTSLMKIWDEYHGYKPLNDSEVRWEPLWQNKRILNGGRPLQGGTWSRAGIQHIADICYPNTGRFLSHTEISNRYNIGCSFLGILKIRMSIPLHWRRMLTDQPNHPLCPYSDYEIKVYKQDLVDTSTIGAKALYTLITEGTDTVPTAYLRWQEDREETTMSNQEEWRDTCSNPFRATRETKLQSLHYKIIHRIFPCGSFLHRVRIRDSEWCAFCDATDSIFSLLSILGSLYPRFLKKQNLKKNTRSGIHI